MSLLCFPKGFTVVLEPSNAVGLGEQGSGTEGRDAGQEGKSSQLHCHQESHSRKNYVEVRQGRGQKIPRTGGLTSRLTGGSPRPSKPTVGPPSNPAVIAATVVALGLGIGASSMIFSVVNAVLLRPLPYWQPERLVMVWERIVNFGAGLTAVPAADYADFRDQNRVFESIAALEALSFNLSGASEPSRVKAARVSHAVWRMLGAEVLEGRVFGAGEDQYEGAQVAVVSYGLWQRQFGGDARLVGRAIRLDDRPYSGSCWERCFRSRTSAAEAWSVSR